MKLEKNICMAKLFSLCNYKQFINSSFVSGRVVSKFDICDPQKIHTQYIIYRILIIRIYYFKDTSTWLIIFPFHMYVHI